MAKNIGSIDRLLRLIIACILLGFAWWQSSWIALLIGLFVLLEAAMSWCVVYQLLGKNSCPIDKNKQ